MTIDAYIEERIRDINKEYELMLNRRLMPNVNKKIKAANYEGQLSELTRLQRMLAVERNDIGVPA